MRPSQSISNNTWSGDWSVLKSLIPYFMEFPGRVMLAMICLILAKFASVAIPFAMKYIVDALDTTQTQIIAVSFTWAPSRTMRRSKTAAGWILIHAVSTCCSKLPLKPAFEESFTGARWICSRLTRTMSTSRSTGAPGRRMIPLR